MSEDLARKGAAEARAARAGIARLLRERRGRALDLESLLAARHLSRVCSFRCPAVSGEQSRVRFLERRLAALLEEMNAGLSRCATRAA